MIKCALVVYPKKQSDVRQFWTLLINLRSPTNCLTLKCSSPTQIFRCPRLLSVLNAAFCLKSFYCYIWSCFSFCEVINNVLLFDVVLQELLISMFFWGGKLVWFLVVEQISSHGFFLYKSFIPTSWTTLPSVVVTYVLHILISDSA